MSFHVLAILVILGEFINKNAEFFSLSYAFIISKCPVDADTASWFRFL